MHQVATREVDRATPRTTAARARIGPLLVVLGQLAMVLLVIRAFQLESRTFFHVTALAVGGFAVHAALPRRFRLGFFVALSLAAIGVAFGPVDGLWLIAVGVALIGVCHLPIAFGWRVSALLGVGGLLAGARAGLLPVPWRATVWPILASMFMFRLALYLHAIRHSDETPDLKRSLAYFFMLPNVTFPLFPVIDFGTFGRTYYDRDALEIYRTGARWIVRGLVHLLLYRFVYQHVLIDPAQLADLGDLLQFLLGTFLLYLRVSGQFHLIVGILHLYGFRLPETHRLYYLASSFTDFWRRINIYWKDFMMKLVYYPVFFRLRTRGTTAALVGATVVVFLATWLLHSYQWFWLRGGFPITAQDALFWGLLGVLVVVNALREADRGRDRSLGRRRWSPTLAWRTVGTFVVICVLWSLWSVELMVEWLWMWRAAAVADTGDVVLLACLGAGAFFVAGYAWGDFTGWTDRLPRWARNPTLQTTATLGGLLALAQPTVHERFPEPVAATVASLRQPSLNAQDEQLQHNGYYEHLDNPSRMSSRLWEALAAKPDDWEELPDKGILRQRSDFLAHDLRPSMGIIWNGHAFTTNRWGMRDRDYGRRKPAGTIRIALLGQSHVMGANVSDGRTFQHRLEERLNDELGRGTDRRYQVLNFAVAAHAVSQELALFEQRAASFEPDIVMLTLPDNGRDRLIRHLLGVVGQRRAIPYPGLRRILRDAGVDSVEESGVPVPFATTRRWVERLGIEARMPWQETRIRIREAADAAMDWAVRRSAEAIRSAGAVPVLLALSTVGEPPEEPPPGLRAAHDAGFVVLNLFDVYGGHDPSRLKVAPWDDHPNARAHGIVADRLFTELRRNADALGLDLSPEMIVGPIRSPVPGGSHAQGHPDRQALHPLQLPRGRGPEPAHARHGADSQRRAGLARDARAGRVPGGGVRDRAGGSRRR